MKGIILFLKIILFMIFSLQEFLLSSNININKIFLLLVDILLLICLAYYLIRSINNMQMYIIYIYSIVTKITIIYFLSFPQYIINSKNNKINNINNINNMNDAYNSVFISNYYNIYNDYAYPYISTYYNTFNKKLMIVTICILITILVYILLFYITDFYILNIHKISIEHILFFLIITHVSIDFIDISQFFYSSYSYFFLYYFRLKDEIYLFKDTHIFSDKILNKNKILHFYNSTINIFEVVFITYGVLISLNISLHAYSFPNYSYEEISSILRIQQNDINRKFMKHKSSLHNNLQNNEDHIYKYNSNKYNIYNNQDENNIYKYINTSNIININKYNNHLISNNNSYKYINSDIYYNNNTSKKKKIKKQKCFSKIAGDAMSCLKYISIYSFLLTDISFFLSRLLLFVMLQTVSCSLLFMIKNICFIIIHGARIYRKSKYHNHKKKKKQTKKNIHKNSTNVDDYKKKKKFQDVPLFSNKDIETKSSKKKCGSSKDIDKMDIHSNKNIYFEKNTPFDNIIPSDKIFFAYTSRFSDIININEIDYMHYNRINHFNYEKIKTSLYFYFLKYNGISFKKYISCYIDNIEKYSMRYFFIIFFFFIFIAIKITILVITYTFHFDDLFNKCIYEFTYNHNFNIIKSCVILKINFIIIISYTLSSFILYIFTSSFFDAIFMPILHFFNMLSYTFVLIIMSQYNPSYDFLNYFNRSKNIAIVLLVFIYLVYLFLADLYIFIYMLLGRRYITYKYKKNIKKRKDDDNKNNIENINNKTNYVSESISVISSLIIKLIIYMNSPLSLNKIIIGNNLIKNTRLDNFLFFSHIKEITVKLILYFICLFISLRYKYINILFILTLFFINIILSTLYLIFSKINRNVAMEYIFAQAIYANRSKDHYKGINLLEFEKKEYEKYSYDYMILFDNTLNYY
ncbi:conserved Plasmodium membrane protein, unknown function [Plasmodium gaboni]|uniref:Uncharacterized protein n=1 Tax=Plasmodium gaboni TaxID=647221 RepID=A0ABY1UK81_9APIC|nr:conserved Plasmodium membrane protein, unknown function [Plasmodium gaboni]